MKYIYLAVTVFCFGAMVFLGIAMDSSPELTKALIGYGFLAPLISFFALMMYITEIDEENKKCK